MSRRPANRAIRSLVLAVLGLALVGVGAALPAARAAETAHAPRIEARSANFLAVGILDDHDRMTLRLSRLLDNAPVPDAIVTVTLRGTVHPTTAQADGSYAFNSPDLGLPGSAALQVNVREGALNETLMGTLQRDGNSNVESEEKNSARQMWWWVLNIGVCVGFMVLFARRRKAAED